MKIRKIETPTPQKSIKCIGFMKRLNKKLKEHNKKWKRRNYIDITEIQKNHERLGTVIVCQEIGQPRRKKEIPRNIQLGARLNQEESDNLNRLISSGEIANVKTKTKKKTKHTFPS